MDKPIKKEHLSKVKAMAELISDRITSTNPLREQVYGSLMSFARMVYWEGYNKRLSESRKMKEFQKRILQEDFKVQMDGVYDEVTKNKKK